MDTIPDWGDLMMLALIMIVCIKYHHPFFFSEVALVLQIYRGIQQLIASHYTGHNTSHKTGEGVE